MNILLILSFLKTSSLVYFRFISSKQRRQLLVKAARLSKRVKETIKTKLPKTLKRKTCEKKSCSCVCVPAVFDKILDEMHLRSQRPVASASRFAAVGLLRLALALPRVPVPQVAPAVLALDGYKVEKYI